MTELTVIEAGGSVFADYLSHHVAPRCPALSVSRISPENFCRCRASDIVVVTPDSMALSSAGALGGRPLDCRILLLPGDCTASFARADCVVTYGMNPRNTLTLSSIGESESMLALQRELVTADGVIVDRQELVVPSSDSADNLLAMSGVMLLLGLLPE